MPKRIVLTGFMGAGKSAVGFRLAQALGWSFIDLDEEIVREARKSIAEIFAAEGEARFREREHQTLAAHLDGQQVVLALGGGALETTANRTLLAANPETWLVYLEASLEVLIARCERQRMAQPDAPLRPVLERRDELAARFLTRQPLYQTSHFTIPTAELNPDEIVLTIMSRLQNHDAGCPQ